MKKLISVILITVMMVVLTSCSSSADKTVNLKGDTVKIGIFEPMTGENGAGGKQEIFGIQYANSQIQSVQVGQKEYKIELVYADNESSEEKAITAAQNLIDAGCSIIIGSYGSDVSIAAGGAFKSAGIPVIGASCTNPKATKGNDCYFRVCFLNDSQGSALADYAREDLGAAKAYVLVNEGNSYSRDLATAFTTSFGEDRCVIESFTDGESNFFKYVSSATGNGCDVFFAPVSLEDGKQLIEAADASKMTLPIIAGDTFDSGNIIEAAKGKDVELYVTSYYQSGTNASFDSGFRQWIRDNASDYSNGVNGAGIAAATALGYDAYGVAIEALKGARNIKPSSILSSLKKVKYAGLSGYIEFDRNGDVSNESVYIKKLNAVSGKWEFVTVVTQK